MSKVHTKVTAFGLGVQALKAERAGRLRDGAPSEVCAATEEALVDMLASMCRLDLQTGNTELAVSRLQANLEYSCFPAPVMAGELGVHV